MDVGDDVGYDVGDDVGDAVGWDALSELLWEPLLETLWEMMLETVSFCYGGVMWLMLVADKAAGICGCCGISDV